MNDFIAGFCHRNDHKINRHMFERTYDKPLHEYIVDTCKNLEVIPGLTLVDWWLERDQTKIHPTINKRNAKDPRVKNNRALERLVQPNRTLYDLLYLVFRVEVKGQKAEVVRKVRVLKPIRGGLYLRNGKKVRILNQVVDNSTFVKGTTLQFKLKLYPIKLSTVRTKLRFHNDDAAVCSSFRLDLLSKVTNPLIYFLAEYTLDGTLRKFGLESVISVVDAPLDEDEYLYLKVSPDVYLEVHEKAFYSHEFIATFTATLYDLLREDKSVTFREVYDREYWYGRLSEIFSKKRYANKALRVLVSFKKVMDEGTKKHLALPRKHRKSTFTILRWMMTNYGELLKKDSHDLRHKRVRANETLAYFFDKHVSRNVYSLLNTDNPPFEKYIRLLNSINEFTLLKGAHGGGKTSPTSMFRYERYNDFDAIEISRFTLKGPTGLNGGKKGISLKYRDIYPSHLGRYDVNVCTSSDPGITGYLCANAKMTDLGYFDLNGGNEPDDWDMAAANLIDRIADPDYYDRRQEYVRTQLSRDSKGFYVLRKRITREQIQYEMNERELRPGQYKTAEGYRLTPRMPKDAKGFPMLIKRKGVKTPTHDYRDADGFFKLVRVVNKATRLGIK